MHDTFAVAFSMHSDFYVRAKNAVNIEICNFANPHSGDNQKSKHKVSDVC